jgi:hypothetical protein
MSFATERGFAGDGQQLLPSGPRTGGKRAPTVAGESFRKHRQRGSESVEVDLGGEVVGVVRIDHSGDGIEHGVGCAQGGAPEQIPIQAVEVGEDCDDRVCPPPSLEGQKIGPSPLSWRAFHSSVKVVMAV